MNRIQYIALFAGILLSGISAFAQNEENIARKVTFRQEGQGVVIEYRISGAADVTVFFSDNGGKTYYGPLTAVSGDVGTVKGEGKKKVMWLPLEEIGGIDSDDVCFKVVAVPVQKKPATETVLNQPPMPEVVPLPAPVVRPEKQSDKPAPVGGGKNTVHGILTVGGGAGFIDGNAGFALAASGVVSFPVGKSVSVGGGAGIVRVPTLKTYKYSSTSFSEEAKVFGAENLALILADLRIRLSGNGVGPYVKIQGGPGLSLASGDSLKGKIYAFGSAGFGYPIIKGLCFEGSINFCGSGSDLPSEANLISSQWGSLMPMVSISYQF